MASKVFTKSFGLTLYDQKNKDTWGFIPSGNIPAFQEAGCAVCSIAALLKKTPKEVMTAGYYTAASPEITKWQQISDYTASNYTMEIASQILLLNRPVIIKVNGKGGHFCVASGFNGLLAMDADGRPYTNGATPEMIKITDPNKGTRATLKAIIDYYGPVAYLRY